MRQLFILYKYQKSYSCNVIYFLIVIISLLYYIKLWLSLGVRLFPASLGAGASLIPGPTSAPDSFQKWMTVTFPLFSTNLPRFHTTLAVFLKIGPVLYSSAWFRSTGTMPECPLSNEMDPSAGNRSAKMNVIQRGFKSRNTTRMKHFTDHHLSRIYLIVIIN